MHPAFYPYCERGHRVTSADNGKPCGACASEDAPAPMPAETPEVAAARFDVPSAEPGEPFEFDAGENVAKLEPISVHVVRPAVDE